jgi:hypothetical protein
MKYASFEEIVSKIEQGKMSKRYMLAKQFQHVLLGASVARLNVRYEPMMSSVLYGIQLSNL